MPPIDPVTAQKLKDAGFDLGAATDPNLPLQPSMPGGPPVPPGVNNTTSSLSTASNTKPEASALAGLISAQNQPGFTPSTMELYSLANRDPNTVAPGSNNYWQHQLNESNKQDDFKQYLSNENDKANNVAMLQGFLGAGGEPTMPAQKMAMAQRAAEAAKANVPIEQEKLRAASNERIQGMKADEIQRSYDNLKAMLSNPNFAGNPLASITGGASPHVSFQTPAQQIPGGPVGAHEVELQKQLNGIENPGPIGRIRNTGMDAIANALGMPKATSTATAERLRTQLGRNAPPRTGANAATPYQVPRQQPPIIQHSPSTGKTRISYDGGATWQQQ